MGPTIQLFIHPRDTSGDPRLHGHIILQTRISTLPSNTWSVCLPSQRRRVKFYGSSQREERLIRRHHTRSQKHLEATWETLGCQPTFSIALRWLWERALGQIRHIIDGYLLPKKQRPLRRKEFHTVRLHCAQIVNSTPLHDLPENPNDPQPITPTTSHYTEIRRM